YNLGGSLVGLVLGSAAALGLAAVGNAALQPFGLRLEPHLEPRSLVLSLSLGTALTILSTLFAAWRATRLSPLAALQDLPDPPARHRAVLGSIGLLPAGLLALWAARTFDYGLALTIGVLCVVVGCAAIARVALRARGVSQEAADRLAFTLAGLALLVYWLLPFDAPLAPPRPRGRNLDTLLGAGCSLVLGVLWVVVYNLRSLLRPLEAGAGRTARLRLGLRLAASYPASAPGRTGLTAGMFTLVIFSMVVSSVLLTATHRAYSDPEALSGGFDVRADLTHPADLPDLPAAITQAEAIRPEDVTGIGRLTDQPVQVIDPAADTARWQPSTLRMADAGFVEGLRSPLASRAREFSSDRQLWEALVSSRGLAVLSSPSSTGAGGSPLGDPPGAPLAGGAFQPTTIWARDDRGQAIPLRVVGLLDPRVTFGAGLYTGHLSLQDAGWSPPPRTAYYIKAADGVAPESLALGLSASFQAQGLRASAIGEDIRRIQSVRTLLNELLQGFFGIGLLAGLAALGLLALRAVMDRRYQIGLLRTLGASRRLIALTVLAEATIVATIGTTLGIVLGLALAGRLVEHLARQNPELVFSVPVGQVAGIAALAWVASLAMTAAPARGAAVIPPVDALRDPL
ncbi:MAG: FtsX-like permease family protein, partial [Chloroflexi bacterium]|nr:FtsX-like permease family protein [Chloroflexota bacterium]